MEKFEYSTQSVGQVAQELSTSLANGLSKEEAAQRLKKYGHNELSSDEAMWWNILIAQLQSPFIYLLIAASLIAFLVTKDYFEGGMIVVIIAINTLLGFYQEYKASQVLQMLKSYIVAYSKVVRDGKREIIASALLVPGDLIELEPGDVVPADLRVVSEQAMFTDESMLTGESVPVAKTSEPPEKTPKQIFQATNLCFAGTTVVAGKGQGIILSTGGTTAIGSISQLVAETVRQSSFAKGIGQFSKFILRFVLMTITLIFFANVIIKHKSIFDAELLIFVVALAVTIIPEMLPTVTTFSLAHGALQLAKHKVVVKRLTAIEDLGSVQILCTDKTGTLTENELVVADVFGSEKNEILTYASLMANQESITNKKHASFAFDVAILKYMPESLKATLHKYKRIDEVPFEPVRRRSSVLVEHDGKKILIVRGAYEELLKISHNISQPEHHKILDWIATQGQEGRRVIAVGNKTISSHVTDLKKAEHDMTFLGIISFVDPIKKTSFAAIKEARMLEVEIKILTGDSPEVARAVATKIGLISTPQEVITGEKFAALSRDEKKAACKACDVFARVSPDQKYEIIGFLQQYYEVGYLGDGINDAPALKLANVAIVVKGAADVAQEAADIVLLKQSLFVIVDGIRQGRRIFANTIKYLKITIASNFGHFYSIALASLLFDYIPLLPLQMLLLNIITDFPMIAVATDNVDVEQLKEPHGYNIHDIVLFSLALSPISTIFDFAIFGLFYKISPSVMQTAWFVGAVVTELMIIISLRTQLPFYKAARPSWPLLGFIALGITLTVSLLYTKLGELFHFVPLTPHQLLWVFGTGAVYFMATEYAKLAYYHIMNKSNHHKKLS